MNIIMETEFRNEKLNKATFHADLVRICEELHLRPTYITSLSEYMDMPFDIYIAGFHVKGKSFLLQARLMGDQVSYHIMITRDFKNKHGVRKITYQDILSGTNLGVLLSRFKKEHNVYYKLK